MLHNSGGQCVQVWEADNAKLKRVRRKVQDNEDYQVQPWSILEQRHHPCERRKKRSLGALYHPDMLLCILHHALAGYEPLRHYPELAQSKIQAALVTWLQGLQRPQT